MPKAWGIALLLGVLLVGGFGISRAVNWRQAKLALLSEGPVAPVASDAARGGLLLFGDSRIAQWEPLPVRPFPLARAGYPGETAIRLAPLLVASLESAQPAAVFVQMGVNDAVAASLASPDRRAEALAASLKAFETVAQAAEARGVALTISLVVPPIRPELVRRIVYRGEVDRYVAALNAALPAIAAAHGAEVVDPMDVLRGADGAVPERFRRDALHFTPAAYGALDRLLPTGIAPMAGAPRQAEMPA